MDAFALKADQLFDGATLHAGGGVVIRGGRIDAVFPAGAEPEGLPGTALPGLLCPGFVDLQVNGGGGTLFNDQPSVAGIETLGRAHRRLGTTSLLPTLISASPTQLREALEATSNSIELVESTSLRILGIHVEGPYLNRARCGAHPPDTLRRLGPEDQALLSATRAGTTLVTLAPECVPVESIRALCASGVRVFAGHSEASAEDLAAAVGAGLSGVTHLYNAMPAPINRSPGIAGATLGHPDLVAGIIADGAHVDWTSFRAALAALGPDRLFFVSDAMPPTGVAAPAPFSLGGARIDVRGSGDTRHCVLPDGTLAGSCLSMGGAVRNAVREAQIPLADALRMATASPARAIGREREVGALRPGGWADLVQLSPRLKVEAVWIGGQQVEG